jgi:hypothetical protein
MRTRNRPAHPLDFSCMICGREMGVTSAKACSRPECQKAIGELNKAMWEGHLLRNNVDPHSV